MEQVERYSLDSCPDRVFGHPGKVVFIEDEGQEKEVKHALRVLQELFPVDLHFWWVS